MKIGIYEKSLPVDVNWSVKLAKAADAGFNFIEIAIDESQELLNRLTLPLQKRIELRNAAANSGVPIYSLVLSAHRKYAFGSSSIKTRQKAKEIMKKAIDFALDIGVRVIQIAGYYVFYEKPTDSAEKWFLEGLHQGVELATQAGIMLGLENMDGQDITSISKARKVIDLINSPWLQLYPDLGNLSANGLDIRSELIAGQGQIVGIHLKDTRPGEFRRVPFGEGIVPFAEAFSVLREMDYRGPFSLEMWNDNLTDVFKTISKSRDWVIHSMIEGGLIVNNNI